MLHGFGGTARHWDRVTALLDRERYSPLALDLIDAEPLSLDGAVAFIAAQAPERFILCGYSMGGRIALHAALAMGERVSRLVLVSTTAGIEDDAARAERRAADEELAERIGAGSVEEFIAGWRATPLFAGDPEWVSEEVAEDERRLSPRQLAATLRAFGAGTLEPLWGRLGELQVPVVALAGERDARYCATGERLAAAIPGGRFERVPKAGHRLALEAPGAVATAYRA
jgi:2-succinyl-6-hydroxy-2,4-cyclohexadiene-1-carboxylate synthase